MNWFKPNAFKITFFLIFITVTFITALAPLEFSLLPNQNDTGTNIITDTFTPPLQQISTALYFPGLLVPDLVPRSWYYEQCTYGGATENYIGQACIQPQDNGFFFLSILIFLIYVYLLACVIDWFVGWIRRIGRNR